jgi:phosphoglucomutase
MTIKRIKVKETVSIDAPFEGKLKDIIAQLQDWMTEGEWEGIESEYYQDYGDEYYLYKFREENDQEYEKRVKQLEKEREKEKAEKAKAKERKLQQLKKDLASLSDADKKLLGL